MQIRNGVKLPFERRHSFAGSQTGLDEVGQELRIKQNFIALEINKIVSGMTTSHARDSVRPGSIGFRHQHGASTKAFNDRLDPLVVGGDDDLRDGPAGLTVREIDVLRLLARGLSTKEIAQRLVVSPKTASNHIEHIYSKIGVSNRVAASLYAMEHGLVPEHAGS